MTRRVVKNLAKAAVIGAAVGITLRAASGGISGEKDVDRVEELKERQADMRSDEKERLGVNPEKEIQERLSRLDKTRMAELGSLVSDYESLLAQLDSEKGSEGMVKPETIAKLAMLQGQIRQAVGLTKQRADEVRGKLDKNIHARQLRTPDVLDERETKFTNTPGTVKRVANIVFGSPADIEHVHNLRLTVADPDKLMTSDQEIALFRLDQTASQLGEKESHISLEEGRSLHSEDEHRNRRKAA